MRSDSVWNMSASLTRITRQVSRTFDLKIGSFLYKNQSFCIFILKYAAALHPHASARQPDRAHDAVLFARVAAAAPAGGGASAGASAGYESGRDESVNDESGRDESSNEPTGESSNDDPANESINCATNNATTYNTTSNATKRQG